MKMLMSNKVKVIKETTKQLNLTKQDAGKRIDALLKSGILEGGNPDDRWYQLVIENFLRFDLSKLDYKDVFMETLRFGELVLEYDKISGQHLDAVLKQLHSGNDAPEDTKEQIEKFDSFFAKRIWNYFPWGYKILA